MATTRGKSTVSTDDIRDLTQSWDTSLQAQGRSKATRATYGAALARFLDFLTTTGRPVVVQDITRQDVEAFMADLLANQSGATAHNRYRALGTFFRWAVEWVGLDRSPMAGTKPPKVDVPVLDAPSAAEVEAIIAATSKDRTFEGRRDEAILRVLWDTGMRREECAALAVKDVDLRSGVVTVVRGKGGRGRQVGVSAATRVALDRWISRERPKHPQAKVSPRLWLGRKAPKDDAPPIGLIRHVVEARSKAALGRALHPHLLRHAWASRMLSKGLPQSSVQTLGGWQDGTMLARYAAHDATQRALADARRLAFGEDDQR